MIVRIVSEVDKNNKHIGSKTISDAKDMVLSDSKYAPTFLHVSIKLDNDEWMIARCKNIIVLRGNYGSYGKDYLEKMVYAMEDE